MNLSALFPPALIRRVVDDLGAMADAARRLPQLQTEVLDRLDRLAVEVTPIGELSAIRQAADPLPEQLSALRAGLESIDARLSALEDLRTGIGPLHADMRAVRESVDALEPLLRELRNDLGPLGELAEKVPGIG